MRDPKRINRILKLLSDTWKASPDQRFGQLLINNGLITDDCQSWNIEDDLIEDALKKNIRNKERIK